MANESSVSGRARLSHPAIFPFLVPRTIFTPYFQPLTPPSPFQPDIPRLPWSQEEPTLVSRHIPALHLARPRIGFVPLRPLADTQLALFRHRTVATQIASLPPDKRPRMGSFRPSAIHPGPPPPISTIQTGYPEIGFVPPHL